MSAASPASGGSLRGCGPVTESEVPEMLAWPETDRAREVEIVLPAERSLIRVARLAMSGIASMCGFDVDGLDDMKIAVDEVCTALMALGDGSAVRVRLASVVPGGVSIDATVTVSASAALDGEGAALRDRVLEVISDRHELSITDGVARFRVVRLVEREGAPPSDAVAGNADGQ